MKTAAAIQPGYLPWLGFFDLMKRCDVFVIEDCLQYTKQDWRNRNRIRTPQGTAYLTVPVRRPAHDCPINLVEIDNSQPWARRHWNLLRQHYGSAPYWQQYAGIINDTFTRSWARLVDLDLWWITFLAQEFGISTPVLVLSELDVPRKTDKTQWLIDLTEAVGATRFIEGKSGRDFVDVSQFDRAGKSISFQEYVCKPYRQQYAPFISHLSALDLLLNEGPEGGALI